MGHPTQQQFGQEFGVAHDAINSIRYRKTRGALGSRRVAPPVVAAYAEDAKSSSPCPTHLVALLRPSLAARHPSEKLFPGTWAQNRKQTQWLAADLRRAVVDATDDKGRPVTLHAIERRYVVRLIQSGAKVHEVRRIARRTDVATTLKHYTDENMKDLGALANRLPPV